MKAEVVYINEVLLILISTGAGLEIKRAESIKTYSDRLIEELSPYFRTVQVIVNDEVTFTNVEIDK